MNKSIKVEQLENQIRERYDSLSKRLKQVAKYILDNPNSVVFDTVAVIAERAEVPPSTLIRFANVFDFSGFNEMKQVFKESLMESTADYKERAELFHKMDADHTQQHSPENILAVFSHANATALTQLATNIDTAQLNKAVKLLDAANNIFIIGLKRSYSIACYLNYALHHLNRRSYIIDGLGGMFEEQLNLIKPGDVVVAISFAPYAKETLNILDSVAKEGVKQIAITDSQLSPLVSFSDISFVIKEAHINGFRSQCSTMNLVQSLAISLAFQQEEEA
ncbi:Fe-S cluster assembly protein HesB [Gallibacterium salpingitidis]|uniref:Fe-S cluster assembly protein HesB n=1 Tax=Gallibacterium salpingitidis TaxID=505341 RepID=A0A1A7Q2I4_9PAST|nr:MurR/RpiR family transcriptional regulator [Gallibacterium salpingitidis]OBW95388.1 Fe-S cluster assembly protein HesB [Gallibacterium salpingitidis]OBX07999.1 Fe-S cluster assembly protein HesB [Gallibacterium salpingitidis]OBX08454.1 Fe-S cluster assembly protein HesB [Gallibacterium salpingitidis]WKS99098.1 MurR/RpiR family transcriptional regulator [Gallibacterium salpingitidis]